ncbi:hypothetical protein KC19_6G106400 [Ceratodon purpureus]|uniref:Uncharacterized protein n=1 Tax=Ceratodon purpureus TaxID=3225 RepID=A0A8T0HIQ2_CERPU|nr:hypothetical protein KC19_6G106400 [Ceratodon purpureus]
MSVNFFGFFVTLQLHCSCALQSPPWQSDERCIFVVRFKLVMEISLLQGLF